jgi:hypothetical protein
MLRNLAVTLTLGTALAVGVASISTATDYATICLRSTTTAAGGCPPRLIVKFGGGVTPKKLPKHRLAPVAVGLWGKVSTDNGAQPPALRQLTIDFDRNAAVNAKGLPVCHPFPRYQGTGDLRKICRSAIVGSGTANFEITFPEELPKPDPGKLVIFNGGVKAGVTTLYAVAFVTVPTPNSIVTKVKIKRIDKGPYGLQAVAEIPSIAGGYGSLLDFSFKIKQLFTYKGTKQSFALARCPDGHLSAKVSTTFNTGAKIEGTLTKPCTPKG